MMPRQRAAVTPALLSWARRVAGFSTDQAARKAGTSEARLAEWEAGEGQPTLRQLRLLSKAYRRPTAFFYRSETPPEPPGMPDFRLVQEGALDGGDSPALRYEIRRARIRRETALEITALLGHEPPAVDLAGRREEGPEALGERIRRFLGVGVATQFRWTDHYEALREWTRAAERNGVLAFQFSNVEVSEARGFSFSEHPLPAVALNGKDSPRGRIFTLFHELAHIALGRGGLCDLHDRDQGPWLEPFCNAVAAEALVPRDVLVDLPELGAHQGPEWDDPTLAALSNRFMVSREVILRRLLTLRLTTAAFYEAKRAQFLEDYRRQREEGGGFLQYYRRVLRDNGEAFTTLVLDAFDQKTISERDVSHHLGDVKLTHVDTIRGVLTGVVD
jgi:Zn-dependent peptidase ImmA (M78 family)/transcriptional regulator with XRE-family HTH domain